MQRMLFVFVSDHGHTPIDSNKAVGINDLKIVFDELNDTRGKIYYLEILTLIDNTLLSKVLPRLDSSPMGRFPRIRMSWPP